MAAKTTGTKGATKAPAKKAAATAEAPKRVKGERKGPTWRIGVFRNDRGVLATVYVNSAGNPMPYEQPRVGGRKILFTGAYGGVTYAEARQLLLKDAKKAGIKDEPVEKTTTTKKTAAPAATTSNGKAGRVPTRRTKAQTEAEAEVQEASVENAEVDVEIMDLDPADVAAE